MSLTVYFTDSHCSKHFCYEGARYRDIGMYLRRSHLVYTHTHTGKIWSDTTLSVEIEKPTSQVPKYDLCVVGESTDVWWSLRQFVLTTFLDNRGPELTVEERIRADREEDQGSKGGVFESVVASAKKLLLTREQLARVFTPRELLSWLTG